jgi:putative membrane protein
VLQRSARASVDNGHGVTGAFSMTSDTILRSLSALPNFLVFLAVCAAMTMAFTAIYVRVTPYREIDLIRRGNLAASLSLSGALIGFILPVASVVMHTAAILDVVLWGIVAMAVQLGAWLLIHFATGGLKAHIERGETASGAFLAATSIGAGIIDAACMGS